MLDLLEHLASKGDTSLADLSVALDLPRASAHRLLVSLEERAYVEHDEEVRRYRLGPAVRHLASRSTEVAIVRIAAGALSQLRALTGETVNLAVVSGSRIVYAATLDGIHQPRMSAAVGEEVEPHATALGKAILSRLSREAREAFLAQEPYPAYTPTTITTAEALEADLEVCAARGYAVEIEESTLGAACIASPIRRLDGLPIGGLSISGVPARLSDSSFDDLARELVVRCDHIAAQLGVPDTAMAT
jgi:IclR family acetate operon transcriptional repressor